MKFEIGRFRESSDFKISPQDPRYRRIRLSVCSRFV
jgi:hypothetical protein